MLPTIRQQIQAVLEEYTGTSLRTTKVEIVEDPRVYGTYAVRVTLPTPSEPLEFLVRQPFDADTVEEVEFASWPPTSH